MSNVTNQRYVTLGDRPCAARFGSIAGPQRCATRVNRKPRHRASRSRNSKMAQTAPITSPRDKTPASDPVGRSAGPGALDFDSHNETSCAQEQQFGYNNDYLGYLPLPVASNNSHHRLLFVNHEDTNEELMFPDLIKQDRKPKFLGIIQELIYIEISAHGPSIAEIKKQVG